MYAFGVRTNEIAHTSELNVINQPDSLISGSPCGLFWGLSVSPKFAHTDILYISALWPGTIYLCVGGGGGFYFLDAEIIVVDMDLDPNPNDYLIN